MSHGSESTAHSADRFEAQSRLLTAPWDAIRRSLLEYHLELGDVESFIRNRKILLQCSRELKRRIENDAGFWTRVLLSDGILANDLLDQLTRSKQSALHVALDLSIPEPVEATLGDSLAPVGNRAIPLADRDTNLNLGLVALVSTSPRWTSLTIHARQPNALGKVFRSLAGISAPALTTLDISPVGNYVESGNEGFAMVMDTDRLRQLIVRSTLVVPLVVGRAFARLRVLHLSHCADALTQHEMCDVLRACGATLERLVLDDVTLRRSCLDWPVSPTPIELPLLEHFTLGGSSDPTSGQTDSLLAVLAAVVAERFFDFVLDRCVAPVCNSIAYEGTPGFLGAIMFARGRHKKGSLFFKFATDVRFTGVTVSEKEALDMFWRFPRVQLLDLCASTPVFMKALLNDLEEWPDLEAVSCALDSLGVLLQYARERVEEGREPLSCAFCSFPVSPIDAADLAMVQELEKFVVEVVRVEVE
ncbi:hypothetical protein C8F04DRAFT_1190498 [Mycena alexandri]|uniref:Uncharacterized protein n=1 Tax=Mycena alexandri TaxID=1745969 RepID=A0AAD6SED7_9AGAR|nr:hypothetical protein C8F04DRAFT_1190498 [Mycena alexandri]